MLLFTKKMFHDFDKKLKFRHYRKCFIIAIKRFVLCIRNNVVQPTTAANHLDTITPLYRNAGIPCHLTSVISNSNGMALPNTE